jgi:hypothetical protein
MNAYEDVARLIGREVNERFDIPGTDAPRVLVFALSRDRIPRHCAQLQASLSAFEKVRKK